MGRLLREIHRERTKCSLGSLVDEEQVLLRSTPGPWLKLGAIHFGRMDELLLLKEVFGSGMTRRKSTVSRPKLGIVFMVKSQLFIASSPVIECEDYGDFTNYPGDHQHYWTELRKIRVVPAESEYEEHPRGRAVLNRKTGQFSLYLDRCILSKRKVVGRIVSQLHLPVDTLLATDPHYRCFKCLSKSAADSRVDGQY